MIIKRLAAAVRKSSDHQPAASASRVRLSNRLGYRLQNSRYGALAEPNHTLSSLMRLEAKPCWVRLLFFNDQRTPWHLDGAAVALTASIGDGFTPMDAEHRPNHGLWRRVAFRTGFATNDDGPLAQEPSDQYGCEIPGNTREDGRPILVFSDWVALTGLDRVDGPGSLLLVRSHSHASVRFSGSVGPPDPSIQQVHRGHWCPGDATVAPWQGTPQADDTIFACYGVQAISAEPGATVIGIGDSIIHSSCTTGEVSGFGIRACAAISAPGRPVTYVNEGYPGRNSTGFAWNGARMIRHFKPQVALIQTWTQNEDWTRAAADAAFNRAVALVDLARQHGCVPVLVTAAPVFAARPEYDVHRRYGLDLVRAAGNQGIRVLDLDALWGTGGQPNAYRSEFGCGDGMHPSDAGCEFAARVLAPMLQDILSDADK